jgi:hypothetical protein
MWQGIPNPVAPVVIPAGGGGGGATWPNEPAGFTAIFDQDFTAMPINGWDLANPGRFSIVTDLTAPLSPTHKVMQFAFDHTLPEGSGAGTVYNDTHLDEGEHFLGFYVKYSSDYTPNSIDNKLWYPFGSNNFVLGMAEDLRLEVFIQSSLLGEPIRTQNIANNTLTLGSWHQVEFYWKPGSPSGGGTIKWWIDGTLCGSYTNQQWDSSAWVCEEWRWVTVWGGNGGPNYPNDLGTLRIDHTYVSVP